jgi:hypothetical protein
VWAREKKKRKVREGSQPVGVNRRSHVMGPRTSPSASSLNQSGVTERTEKRLSTLSGHSVSTGSEAGSAAGRARGDDGDESEPEDSETPWTCTLVISRLGSVDTARAHSSDSVVRVRVATFSPTPHHPKVVALLKVPFPLPDIIVDWASLARAWTWTRLTDSCSQPRRSKISCPRRAFGWSFARALEASVRSTGRATGGVYARREGANSVC